MFLCAADVNKHAYTCFSKFIHDVYIFMIVVIVKVLCQSEKDQLGPTQVWSNKILFSLYIAPYYTSNYMFRLLVAQ